MKIHLHIIRQKRMCFCSTTQNIHVFFLGFTPPLLRVDLPFVKTVVPGSPRYEFSILYIGCGIHGFHGSGRSLIPSRQIPSSDIVSDDSSNLEKLRLKTHWSNGQRSLHYLHLNITHIYRIIPLYPHYIFRKWSVLYLHYIIG